MTQRSEILIPPTANRIWRMVWPSPDPPMPRFTDVEIDGLSKEGLRDALRQCMASKQGRPFQVKTGDYNKWLERTANALAKSIQAVKTLPVRALIDIHGGSGFPRSRDLDNCVKPVLDALRAAGVLPDDRVQEVASIHLEYKPPRQKGIEATCLVGIEELTDRAVKGIQQDLFAEA